MSCHILINLISPRDVGDGSTYTCRADDSWIALVPHRMGSYVTTGNLEPVSRNRQVPVPVRSHAAGSRPTASATSAASNAMEALRTRQAIYTWIACRTSPVFDTISRLIEATCQSMFRNCAVMFERCTRSTHTFLSACLSAKIHIEVCTCT